MAEKIPLKVFVEPFGETNEFIFKEIVTDTSGNSEFRELKDTDGSPHNVVELDEGQFCKLLRHKQSRCHSFRVFIKTPEDLLQRVQIIFLVDDTGRTFDPIINDITSVMPHVQVEDVAHLLGKASIKPFETHSPYWFSRPAWKQNRRPRYIHRRFPNRSNRPYQR